MITRENFPYDEYAQVIGLTTPVEELTDAEKWGMYEEGVRYMLAQEAKQLKGKGKEIKVLKDNLGKVEDLRNIYGIPEEIEDESEPFSKTTFLSYVRERPEAQIRNTPMGKLLNAYADMLYGTRIFQRTFINDYADKSTFKDVVKAELKEFDTEEPFDKWLSTQGDDGGKASIDDVLGKAIFDDWNKKYPDAHSRDALFLSGKATNQDVLLYEMATNREVTGLRQRRAEIERELIEATQWRKGWFHNFAGGAESVALNSLAGAVRLADKVVEGAESGLESIGVLDEDDYETDSYLSVLADTISRDVQDISESIRTESFADKLFQGAGSLVAIAAGGRFGKAGPALTGGFAGAESGYQDYAQTRVGDFNESEAMKSFTLNGIIGLSEGLPVGAFLNRVGANKWLPNLLKKTDDVTQGSMSRYITRAGKRGRWTDAAITGGIGAVQEGAQEVAQGIASNYVASGLLKYDPERGLGIEESLDEGTVGAALGFMLNSVAGLRTYGQRRAFHNIMTEAQNKADETKERVKKKQPIYKKTDKPRVSPRGDGSFTASLHGKIGVGDSIEAATVNLQEQIKNDSRMGAKVNEGDGGIVTIDLEGNQITVNTTDSAKHAKELADAHNKGIIELLPNVSIVTADGISDTVTASFGGKDGYVGFGGNAVQAMAMLNSELQGKMIITPRAEPDTESVEIPMAVRGFTEENVGNALQGDNGFILLATDDDNRAAVTNGRFRAYKDGVLYTVKSKNVSGQMVAFVEAVDIATNQPYKLPEEVATQPWRELRKLNDGKNTVVELPTVKKGVKVTYKDEAGQYILDSASLDRLAKSLGGEVRKGFSSNDAIVRVHGKDTRITLDPETGQVNVTNGDMSMQFDGDFTLEDMSRTNELNAKYIVEKMMAEGYSLTNIVDGKLHFGDVVISVKQGKQRKQGYTVNLPEEKPVKIWNKDELDELMGFKLSEEAQSREDTNYEQTAEKVQDTSENRGPDDTSISISMASVGDHTQRKQTAQAFLDNRANWDNPSTPTLVNEAGGKVRLDLPVFMNVVGKEDAEVLDIIESALDEVHANEQSYTMNSEAPMTGDNYLDATPDVIAKAEQEILDVFNMLPKQIRDMITLHFTEESIKGNKEFRKVKDGILFGYYTASGDSDLRRLPEIHIDARVYKRSKNDILHTIAEEIAHHGFRFWNTPQIVELYDKMWEVVNTPDNLEALKSYLRPGWQNNPDSIPKASRVMLINEYFAKQGTTIRGFDETLVPSHVDKKRLIELKNEVNKGGVELGFDLTSESTQSQTDFLDTILKAQSSVMLREGFKVKHVLDDGADNLTIEYDIVGDGHNTVHKSQYGSSREARRVANTMWWIGDSDPNSWNGKLRRFVVNDIIGFVSPLIGRESQRNLNEYMIPSVTNRELIIQKQAERANIIRGIMEDHGGKDVPITDTYVDTLTRLGVTDDKSLKLARETDSFMAWAAVQKNENAFEIRQQLRESKNILRGWVKSGKYGMTAESILPHLNAIDRLIDTIDSTWDHRAYEVYQPGGEADLRLMMDAMSNNSKLRNKYNKRLEKAEASVKKLSGKESLTTKQGNELTKARHTIRVNDRLNSLRDWANQLVRNNVRSGEIEVRVTDKIRSELDYQMNQINGVNNDIKGSQLRKVDTMHGRTLNERVTLDRKYMDFLGEITDPLMVSISNLRQQNELESKIKHGNTLAQVMVEAGSARPKGSVINGGSNYSNPLHDGLGLLPYIEFNSLFAKGIKDELKIIEISERQMIDKVVGMIRSSLTTLSTKLNISNYISNISTAVNDGQLSYLSQYAGEAWSASKVGFLQNVGLGEHSHDTKRKGQSLIDEMRDMLILSGSLQTQEAKVAYGQLYEDGLHKLVDFIRDSGGMKGTSAARWNQRVAKFFNTMKGSYGFGDEWPKVMSYLINKDISMTKQRAIVDRNDFAEGAEGTRKYNEHINNIAKREAADKTNRTFTEWGTSAQMLRRLSKNNVRMMTSDFILHPAQMVKIMVESGRVLYEEHQELKWAEENGHTEYAEKLSKRIRSRWIGQTSSYATGFTLMYSGFTPLSFLLQAMLSGDDQDDEDNVNKFKAAIEIDNIRNMQWGGEPKQPIYINGDVVTYVNVHRQNAMNTLFPLPAPIEEQTFLEYAQGFLGRFIQTGGSRSITMNLINTVINNQDHAGRKLGDGFFNWGKAKATGAMFVPGFVKQPWAIGADAIDVATSGNEAGEPNEDMKRNNLIASAAAMVGLSPKSINVMDVASNVGYMMTNYRNISGNKYSNVVLTKLVKTLDSGEDLDTPYIESMLNDLRNKTDATAGMVRNGIKAFREFGKSDEEIRERLRVRTDGVTKNSGLPKYTPGDWVDQIMKGESVEKVLHQQAYKILKGRRERKASANLNYRMGSQDKKNSLAAYDKALLIYDNYMRDEF